MAIWSTLATSSAPVAPPVSCRLGIQVVRAAAAWAAARSLSACAR